MKVVGVYKLCPPAKLYLSISVIIGIIMLYQTTSYNDVFCLGNYNCNAGNKTFLIFIHSLYVLTWTWILNIICANNYTPLSWILVLLPFIVFFIMSASIFRFV
jgi:hypothetical protein